MINNKSNYLLNSSVFELNHSQFARHFIADNTQWGKSSTEKKYQKQNRERDLSDINFKNI